MSRVFEMNTTPITNVLQYEPGQCERYSDWLFSTDQGRSAVEVAKRALGRQDYCWNNGVRRLWVWERSCTVAVGGRDVPWRWRLFASTRGPTLEIEHKGLPYGQAIKEAAPQVLDCFLGAWAGGAKR